MPPSPLVRISPGRDLKSDNHKRGSSLESGILYREKDEDLALFNEAQNKERENFLLQSNDDFDDVFSSKIRYFSDYKHGISIPTRGESSDLLNVEGDKNDYDWLITPPETPLFTSLDDETPANNLASRGRPRSQPISISRSSTMEKGYGSSRGSPSPHRLSPSPQSVNASLQSRSRPFSATNSSPPPSQRPSSPSRKPSPPPSKTPTRPRSHTPTLRRLSTGSSNTSAPSKTRSALPVRTSRGNSASPKIRAWQANIPGFSSEAPPNLRTSLADRPASYVRGSSPAASSRNGSKSGRQSMSPTASRSISSSHSNEKEPDSYRSKGSIASSGDDVDSSLSGPAVSSSDYSAPRSLSGYRGDKAIGSFNKPSKVLSSSAPKRSFDMALRQIEKKGPQNMFRPMLSSVPSATIYAGKGSYLTSSITTSSNASSEQGTSGAVDIEESGQNQEEVSSEYYEGQDKNKHDEEVFFLDHVDTLSEGAEHKMEEESFACEHDRIDDPPSEAPHIVVPGHNSQFDSVRATSASDVVLDKKYKDPNGDDISDKELCSICGLKFQLVELERDGVLQLCRECWMSRVYSTATMGYMDAMLDKNANPLEDAGQSATIQESEEVASTGETGQDLDNLYNEGQPSHIAPSNDVGLSPIAEAESTLFAGQVVHKTSENNAKELQLSVNSSNSNDISEGSGISLLLKRSNSRLGYVVQSRSLTASNISYDELSYVRDSINSMRSSMGYSSASLSSSIDVGSSKQIETRIHRLSSGHKSDTESYRNENPTKHKRSISSLSGASGRELSAANAENELGEATCVDPHELSEASEYAESESTCTDLEANGNFRTAAENSISIQSRDDSGDLNANFEELALQENCGTSTNKSSNTTKEDTSSSGHVWTSFQGQDSVPLGDERICHVENPHISSLHAISEIENTDIDTQSDVDPIDSKRCTNDSPKTPSAAGGDIVAPTVEVTRSDAVHDIHGESTVVLQDLNGKRSKSMTLEEATDAILFCRSIVHDLAYDAADIAIEKEAPTTMDALRPASAYNGESKLERREARSRTVGKRGFKAQKARQRKLDNDAKTPVDETDVSSAPTRAVTDPSKGDSLKPPMKLESKCNCIIM